MTTNMERKMQEIMIGLKQIVKLNNNYVVKSRYVAKSRYNKQPIKHNKNKVVIFCDEFKSFNDFLINNDDQKLLDSYVNKYSKTIYEKKI